MGILLVNNFYTFPNRTTYQGFKKLLLSILAVIYTGKKQSDGSYDCAQKDGRLGKHDFLSYFI